MAKKENEAAKYPELGARLTQFVEQSGETSARQFAIKAGLTASVLSNLMLGYSIPGGETLAALARTYPKFDVTWLLTGKSDSARALTPAQPEPADPPADKVPASYGATVELAITRARVTDRDTMIEQQREEIARLNRELGKPSNGFDAATPARPRPTAPRPAVGFRLGVSGRVKRRAAKSL